MQKLANTKNTITMVKKLKINKFKNFKDVLSMGYHIITLKVQRSD